MINSKGFLFIFVLLTLSLATTSSFAHDDAGDIHHTTVAKSTDPDEHPAQGPAENIGKTADGIGKDAAAGANRIGESAVKGSGDILTSVGQLLQGIGGGMKPAVEKTNDVAPSAPAQNIQKEQVPAEEKDLTGGYKNSPKIKSVIFCSSCGQEFEIVGYPKGSKTFCPSCGKEVEKKQ